MYSSNYRLSWMLVACSGSMLPCCSSISRLAKQLRKSISVFCRAILRFFLMRQATQRSSTPSAGLGWGSGSMAMRSHTFCTCSLMRFLFCFMRYSRNAISVLSYESCYDWPCTALNWRCLSCKFQMKPCLLLTKKASYRVTSTIFCSYGPSNTAKYCLSPLSTKTTVCVGVFKCLINSTYLNTSSKGTFPAGSTSKGDSITSLSEGTSSSRMLFSAAFSCSSMCRLQQVSISSRQNFSRRSCFWTSLSNTPNCGESLSVEKMESLFWKAMVSAGRLMGLGDFFIRWVLFWECLDFDYSPELFYSPSLFSKDIQNYYQRRNNCRIHPHHTRKGDGGEVVESRHH